MKNKTKRILAIVWIVLVLTLSISATAFAEDDPIQVVNNLSDFMFGIIRAIGIILLGFGVVQIGMSLKSDVDDNVRILSEPPRLTTADRMILSSFSAKAYERPNYQL